jgi:uncharacterized protein
LDRYIIHPEVDQDSAPYWESLRGHSARIQKCEDCGQFRFPPAPTCYHCGKASGKWEEISGKGRIYSWIVVNHPVDKRLADEVPFVVALIELSEGPRVVGRLTGCGKDEIRAGLPVRAVYDDLDSELTLLNFEIDE